MCNYKKKMLVLVPNKTTEMFFFCTKNFVGQINVDLVKSV